MKIIDIIRREVERGLLRRARSAVGIIDAYDPNEHAVKVKFDTELDDDGNPRISGWIPLRTNSASAKGVSFVIGPQPGDQAHVEYLEGDPENGVVSGFNHNDVDRPPKVASGQAILQHNSTGNFLTLGADGSLQFMHKSTGNYTNVDKNGNVATYIADPGQTQHYIGGDPTKGGTFARTMTESGPSPYSKTRVS